MPELNLEITRQIGHHYRKFTITPPPGAMGTPGEDAEQCTREECMLPTVDLGRCQDVIGYRRDWQRGYWQCPRNYVITGFKGEDIRDMVVTCCHV